MADSLTVTAKLAASFGSETFQNTTSTSAIDLETGSDIARQFMQDIGSTWEAFDVGDINTAKRYWIYIRNADTNPTSTAYVTVKMKTAATPTYGPDHNLYVGEAMVLPMPAYSGGYPIAGAVTSTGTIRCQIVISDAGDPTV